MFLIERLTLAPRVGRCGVAIGSTAAVAATVLLVGCGGATHLLGSSTTRPSGAAPPRPLRVAAWKQQLDGICATMTRRSAALAKPRRASAVLPFVREVVAAGEAELAQIKAVAPPPQFAAGQRHVVSDLTTIFGRLRALATRQLTSAEFAAALRTPAVLRAAEDYVRRSRAAGLASCVLAPGT